MKKFLKLLAIVVVGMIVLSIFSNGGSSGKETKKESTEASVSVTLKDEQESNASTVSEVTSTSASSVESVQTSCVLLAGSYVVGVDIPVGRAKISGVSGQGNIISSDYDGLNGINAVMITDSSGKSSLSSVFESYRLQENAYLYISQTAVIQLEYTLVTKQCTGRVYSEQPTYELSSGSYTVGVDIEPGVYKVIAESGQGNFIAGNYLEGGANEVMGPESVIGSTEFGNVILKQDDTVVISMTLILSLYKAEK